MELQNLGLNVNLRNLGLNVMIHHSLRIICSQFGNKLNFWVP